VQLNPLIVSVDTEIIGKDNIYGDKSGTDGVLSLIDVGNTGFPNYLINLDTGMKFPIYVPETLNVERQPDDENKILKFTVPAIEENPDAPEMPKYQVLMLKDPMPDTPISSVTREMDAEGTEPVALGKNNVWKKYIFNIIETIKSKENCLNFYFLFCWYKVAGRLTSTIILFHQPSEFLIFVKFQQFCISTFINKVIDISSLSLFNTAVFRHRSL